MKFQSIGYDKTICKPLKTTTTTTKQHKYYQQASESCNAIIRGVNGPMRKVNVCVFNNENVSLTLKFGFKYSFQ